MPDKIKDLRRLVIKAYHINEVDWADKNDIFVDGRMLVSKEMIANLVASEPLIEKIDIQIIKPGDHNRYTESMMDIIPISTKVLGNIGEGITHTITGVYVILTGVDTKGIPTYEFGSSEGNMKEKLYLNRAGTPSDKDYIISFDVTLAAGMGQERPGPTAAHRVCDQFIQTYRDKMKKFKGDACTERHEYHDIVREGKKRVLIIKQVAGQGAMYDTHLFSKEPSGVAGGRSIIDLGNMPVIVTPNEYRDGIIRSMQ
ncbi:MAG: proline reductase cluster protein PrdD [Lachnospiraceae bacterium]